MLGWEFPPFYAGGVGIVCYELTRALLNIPNIEITYIMPYGPNSQENRFGVNLLFANHIKTKKLKVSNIDSSLYAYDSPKQYVSRLRSLLEENIEGGPNKPIKEIYGKNIIEEVYLYAKRVAKLCHDMDFDVIHAHDWTTIPAAFLLKELTGKPVVLHVHITELNKTGGAGAHKKVFQIEKYGFQNADLCIAVSHKIKDMMISRYGVDSNKTTVIHNGGVSDLRKFKSEKDYSNGKTKKVLFAGRVTLQKGPEYFVKAAKRVLEHEPNTIFIFAGSGDLLERMIHLANELGIAEKFIFHGFYTRKEAERFFSEADVFVMPSVSEPFGIVPLEAVSKGTPTIISKQSGISEVLENTFKVDFWDVDEMANKIIGLLRYKPLHSTMSERAFKEYDTFSWDSRAYKVLNTYRKVLE